MPLQPFRILMADDINDLARLRTEIDRIDDTVVDFLVERMVYVEAVAKAKGVSKAADIRHVSIVRSVNGVPHAAAFNLAAISAGKARNPEVIANDVVIVDSSKAKSAWHGLVEMMPALYLLTFL